MADCQVSLIIPAWNEEAWLRATLERYLPILESNCQEFEVLVVVDGSEDHTREVAESFHDRRVAVLGFEERLGKGGAITAGMRAAKYGTIGFIDADGPVTGLDLLQLLRAVRRCDAAIASRWVTGRRFARRQPVSRMVVGRLWNLLVRLALNLPLADTQCGAKLFQAGALRLALSEVHVNNWAIDAAILFRIARNGGRIVEVPVTYTDRPDSKLSIGKAAPSMLATLLALRLDTSRWRGRFPDRLLHQLGLFFGAGADG